MFRSCTLSRGGEGCPVFLLSRPGNPNRRLLKYSGQENPSGRSISLSLSTMISIATVLHTSNLFTASSYNIDHIRYTHQPVKI